jgi:hypothetical protein
VRRRRCATQFHRAAAHLAGNEKITLKYASNINTIFDISLVIPGWAND